ncbi:MAG: ATP-binding protein [Bacteroidales bacterium]|nr:ATP-binding protein [Bacteroidales bacterium]MBS3774661.1 ATP-binding protein [Bacteroidales bacterium]
MKIAIASGKGGTGKTTLATNLASLCSSVSRNTPTVLSDLDVEEPNSGIFLKGKTLHQKTIMKEIPEWIPEKCTFCNRCKEVCNFNAIAVLPESVLVFPELCHSCYACVGLCPENALVMQDHPIGELNHYKVGQLDFIEGKLNIGEQQAVPLISKTIDYTKENFPDHSLFLYDSPPGTSCPVIESVKEADYVILVAEPTPFGLHDLKLSVKTMRKVGKAFGVVINRHGLGNNDIEQFCREEQVTILGRIPNMPEIAKKYSRGELIIEIPEIRREMFSILAKTEEEVTGELTDRENHKTS